MNPVVILFSSKFKSSKQLSFWARLAVKESSLVSKIQLPFLGNFRSNKEKGIYWSLSHKRDIVTGISSLEPVGIDVEDITPRSLSLFKRI